MTENLFKAIKQQLLEEKEALEKELKKFAQKSIHKEDDYESEFPNYGDKEDDNATEVSTFADRLSLEGDLENKLQEVNRALEKIEAGTYGVCENCGKKIEEERLKVFPAAALCIACGKKK